MFASGHGVYDAMKPETSAQINSGENQIVVYQPDETIRLDVRLENETVWLNRHQMAQLFGREVKTIGKHIVNALSEELACCSGGADFATTQRQKNPTSAKFAQGEVPLNPTVAKFAIVELIANCDRFGQWVLNLIADMKEAS